MSLFVNTNSEALIAQINVNNNQDAENSAETDLSSGLRINTAADDAAGYAISEDLTSQVNGLNQANSNAQDATSLIQTADGALNDVNQMLQRIYELSIEYQGGTLDSTDQAAITAEVGQLICQIEQIGTQAQFNGIALFSATANSNTGAVVSTATVSVGTSTVTVDETLLTFQVGANDGEVISISIQTLSGANSILSALTNNTTTFLASFGESGILASLSGMIDAVSTLASQFGAVQNRLSYTMNNLSTYSENLSSAQATIQDVDMASETTEFTKDQILVQSSISMLSQSQQNAQSVLKLIENA